MEKKWNALSKKARAKLLDSVGMSQRFALDKWDALPWEVIASLHTVFH